MTIRYRVDLNEAEHSQLAALLNGGTHAVRKIKRAQILLAADAGASDEVIASPVSVGVSTIYRTRRRCVEGNLELAVSEEARPGASRKLSGEETVLLVATACSAPPAGRKRWTLELLAGEMVRLTEPELWISLDLLAFQRDGWLAGSVGVGDEAGQGMDHGVHGGSVAGMLKAPFAFQDIEHGLDDEALAQHDLVAQQHQVVAHVAPDAGDEMQAALPELGEHRAADIALVGVELACQVLGDLTEHGAVGGVAGGDLQRHDLALVVDHEMQLEAIEPAHGGLAAGGQAVEDLVAVDAAIVADSELGRVGEVDAGLLAVEAVQQHHQRGEQPRHQADEAILMRQVAKAGAMLAADPVEIEHLEMLVRREVKQHHDEQHLGARQLARALLFGLPRRDQLVRFPVREHFAEVIKTAVERCDIHRA